VTDERRVRTKYGLIPLRDLENHGFSINKIKEWREHAFREGRPHELADFYATHGLCYDCGGQGVLMIGWSEPRDEKEGEAAKALNVTELPVYEVCSTCRGSGKADRSSWKKPTLA
jgi:hypothetical protein